MNTATTSHNFSLDHTLYLTGFLATSSAAFAKATTDHDFLYQYFSDSNITLLEGDAGEMTTAIITRTYGETTLDINTKEQTITAYRCGSKASLLLPNLNWYLVNEALEYKYA